MPSHSHTTSDLPTIPVSKGGTGLTTITSGKALIGNGTSAVATRTIKDMTAVGPISDYSTSLMTTNTLVYWNGAYSTAGASNLKYCVKGEFGTIITKNAGDYITTANSPFKNHGKITSSTTITDLTTGIGYTQGYDPTKVGAYNYGELFTLKGTKQLTQIYFADGGRPYITATWDSNSLSSRTWKQIAFISDIPTIVDTKNTAGSTNSTSKLFLIGATSQAANPQTYSNSSCYVSSGYLYSGGTKVSVEGHTHEILTSANSIIVNRTSTSNPVIAYQSNGTLVGVLGFDTNGKLVVSPNRSSNTIYYDVIHSGNISSQSVASATTATTMSSFDAASSSDTKRYVWMSWDDNSGKPAYSSKLTFQTSTNTLFVNDKAVSLSDHTHSNYLPKAGGTMTGKLNMNGTAYPQIYGNSTYLAFGYNSSSSQVVIDSTCLRRGSSATVSLGSSGYPWSNFYASAATLTGALTISGTNATTSTINFTRDGYSYISSKGVFAIEPKGLASSGTTGYQFDASTFYPGATLTYNIGTSTLGFNKTYTRYIDTAGSNYNLRFCASGTEGMNLTASKKLYVGGSTSATYTLQVNGEAYATNFITSSDKRLKTNIKEISNSEKSLELPFYEFDYKSDNRHSYGHIAQDVEEIYPTCVMHDNTEDDYLSLDYTTLHSIQIKALIDEINKLKEEIRSLKASNVKFK